MEFLGVRDSAGLLESDLEQALMNKLQQFLLELGQGESGLDFTGLKKQNAKSRLLKSRLFAF